MLQDGTHTITKTGNYTTYSASDLCTAPANTTGYIFPGIFNRVVVDGLTPSTRYYYSVGDPVCISSHTCLHQHDSCECMQSCELSWPVTNRLRDCGAMQIGGYSKEFQFTTAPEVAPNSSISILMWADSGHAIDDGSYEWEW